ncbi:hypothetical protein PR048_027547 [Dryococelus australis]|uniref:Uncharacterized protein n=1 Tax=Dryococelus australis TaxID=614101 RepID=A0ABQ9GGU0_9NEOP|nr:hypothetical protein PR048_027547 [Dryococelus australis]
MKGRGKREIPEKNPLNSDIVRHDSHMRKSGNGPAGAAIVRGTSGCLTSRLCKCAVMRRQVNTRDVTERGGGRSVSFLSPEGDRYGSNASRRDTAIYYWKYRRGKQDSEADSGPLPLPPGTLPKPQDNDYRTVAFLLDGDKEAQGLASALAFHLVHIAGNTLLQFGLQRSRVADNKLANPESAADLWRTTCRRRLIIDKCVIRDITGLITDNLFSPRCSAGAASDRLVVELLRGVHLADEMHYYKRSIREGASEAQWLERTWLDSGRGSFRVFAPGNLASRCRWSAGFLGDIPLTPSPLLHSGAAPYLPCFTTVRSQDPEGCQNLFPPLRSHQGVPMYVVDGPNDRSSCEIVISQGIAGILVGRAARKESHTVCGKANVDPASNQVTNLSRPRREVAIRTTLPRTSSASSLLRARAYNQDDENTARQFKGLRIAVIAHSMREAVSPLSLPRFSAVIVEKTVQVGGNVKAVSPWNRCETRCINAAL